MVFFSTTGLLLHVALFRLGTTRDCAKGQAGPSIWSRLPPAVLHRAAEWLGMNYAKRRTWLPFLVLITLATPVGTLQAQTPASELVTTKGTVVSRETSPGAWLLELDRSVQTITGRVRSVALALDQTRGQHARSARAIGSR